MFHPEKSKQFQVFVFKFYLRVRTRIARCTKTHISLLATNLAKLRTSWDYLMNGNLSIGEREMYGILFFLTWRSVQFCCHKITT